MVSQKNTHKYIIFINAVMITLLAVILYFFQFLRDTFTSPLSAYYLSLFSIFCGALWDGFTLSSNEKIKRLNLTKNRKLRTRLYFRQWLFINIFLFSYLFLFRDLTISRLWLTSFSLILLPFCHVLQLKINPKLFNYIKQRYNNLENEVLFIGSDSWVSSVAKNINLNFQSSQFSSKNFFVAKSDTEYSKIKELIISSEVKYIIVEQGGMHDDLFNELMRFTERRGIQLSIQLNFMNHLGGEFEIEKIGPYHLMVESQPYINEDFNRVAKRIFDIIFSVCVIILIMPPLVLFVLAIQKICNSKGKIFFTQIRLGRYNKPFKVIKFRTMSTSGFNECEQAKANDPRIYKGGAFLRKFNIDEIPQFLNVLLGHMSVVGPRPHLEKHEREFENLYMKYGKRRLVKPGITGLAQIKGYRGEIKTNNDIRYRAKFDIFYVINWSLLLDLKIITKTIIQCIIPNRNAY